MLAWGDDKGAELEEQCKAGTTAIGTLGKEWKIAKVLNMCKCWAQELSRHQKGTSDHWDWGRDATRARTEEDAAASSPPPTASPSAPFC